MSSAKQKLKIKVCNNDQIFQDEENKLLCTQPPETDVEKSWRMEADQTEADLPIFLSFTIQVS